MTDRMRDDPHVEITAFDNEKHREQVTAVWQSVFGYDAAHNRPELVIDQKLKVDDGLFFVALQENRVVGTAMAGYDGHRGWIYSVAVLPEYRKLGIGSALLSFAQEKLASRGCLKINLQVAEGNEAVQNFYLANGYEVEKRISMGKRLYTD